MRVLMVGGAGYVAGLVMPILVAEHSVRVFDLRPPPDVTLDHVVGNVADRDALLRAAEGCDALLYMAMGDKRFALTESIITNFDVSVRGLYLALDAANAAGIGHAVYTSSMSVYEGDLLERRFDDEAIAPDADHFYGLSKRLGEEICRSAVRAHGMSINVLRLCFPLADADWQAQVRPGEVMLATAATDLARALLAALTYRDGFQAFTISGDHAECVMGMSKARRLLGWAPLARPQEAGDVATL
ncbi:MAG TPA: NAD(P)-dependent oxidoreductase [Roseiflexaceae bacterium]|nr:NAD(P)-dependent oxidoreductase [Roseiflexaceae bacterium]HMP42006.1 NAD(P)-dependent oxidoreductase [Roseiflexaceae bacterium]